MLHALVLVLACQRPAAPPVAADATVPVAWQSPHGHDHPWSGRIWSARRGEWIDFDRLVAQLEKAEVTFLGGRHDNPDHHLLQARLLDALVEPGTPVLFEMLDLGDAVLGATDPASLAAAVARDRGRASVASYEPVFRVVFERGGRVLPARPPPDQVETVLAGGIDALPPHVLESLRLRPLSDEQYRALGEEVVAPCGWVDLDEVWQRVDVHVFEDAALAGALTQAGFPAILVAEGSHTRPDRGVPHHLGARTSTVLFQEVRDDQSGLPEVDGAADYVWYTARLDDEDPCEDFRNELQRARFR